MTVAGVPLPPLLLSALQIKVTCVISAKLNFFFFKKGPCTNSVLCA